MANANAEYEEYAVDGGEEDEYEVEELVDDTPMRVYGRVFLGSIDAARNRAALVRANVGITLALLGAGDERVESSNDESGDSERLTRMLVEMEDSVDEPLLTRLPALLATLQEALMDAEKRDCNVLVHCMAGRSRSPSLVAAWLMVTRQYTLQQALDLIEMVRPWIEINDRFRRDLDLFSHVLRCHKQSESPASVDWTAELTSHHLALLPRLDFGSSLVADILAHDKTVTMRLLSDVENDPNSDLLRVLQHSMVVATTASEQDATNRDAFAFLRIDRVDTGITLASMTPEMVAKTGSTSKDHVLSVLQTFYPDVTPQTPLLVLSFTCIGSTRTK